MRVRELLVRYGPLTPEARHDNRRPVRDSSDVLNIVRPLIGDSPVEVFGVLCLTTALRALCWHEVSRGTLDASLAHPREIFRAAILSNASCIVLAHNHPSGNPTPSPEDRALTARLVQVGRIVGIEVMDHIVVGDGHFSFREHGQL